MVACSDMSFVFFDSTPLEMEEGNGALAQIVKGQGGSGSGSGGGGGGGGGGSGSGGGSSKSRAPPRMPRAKVLQRTHISTSQRLLAWCSDTGIMYSAGTDFVIVAWRIEAFPGGPIGSHGCVVVACVAPHEGNALVDASVDHRAVYRRC